MPNDRTPAMPDIQAHTLITRSDATLATDVDGETILMHLEHGNYYGLKGTARHIWEMIETPLQFGDLCKRLTEKYASTPERIEQDVAKFLSEMSDEEVITLT
jgi:hypothetical protein